MRMEPTTYSVQELLDLRVNNMLAPNPEYQRGAVWNPGQKKRLIDSMLRGYPIPLIYLHHIKRQVASHTREDFEIIDGQQRMNAIYEFKEGAFPLFDPVRDDAEARFPAFVKASPCPWGGKDFGKLDSDVKARFLSTPLSIVKIVTDDPNEARDLFIRLQAGMPLNAQEKRDAWPGGFTEFVLKLGGKSGLARYPGHRFFTHLVGATETTRGKVRQLAAQIAMLFLTRYRSGGQQLGDTNARAIDSFYYQNLAFDAASDEAARFDQVLNRIVSLIGDKKGKKLGGHEAIHLVLLVDSLFDEYTRSWESRFATAFEMFRLKFAEEKLTRDSANPGVFWTQYGQWTRVNSDRGDVIRRRHEFFVKQMYAVLQPAPKDPIRLFGPVEREIVYYRDRKRCAVCAAEVSWEESEIHHVSEHAEGGRTELKNGVLVHGSCHPKGPAAKDFATRFNARSPDSSAEAE